MTTSGAPDLDAWIRWHTSDRSAGGGCYAAGLNGIPAGFIRSSQ
jgi:hypothetical protein